MKKTIAIITSDPKSINYEIIKKSLFFFNKKNKNKYLFIGSKKLFIKNVTDEKKLKNINIIDVQWKNHNDKSSYLRKSFEIFFNLYKEKKVNALINLPLNKKKFFGTKYPGVTEYLSSKYKCSGNETMLLYNSLFSVSPLTTHIKIKDISKKINKKKIITNFKNIYLFYKKILKINNPKIGILGLNPHNAIDFNKNTEERNIIYPAIKNLKKKYKKNIFGPISPDVSFLVREQQKINSLIGIYHDQVLTSFKYINKYSAINITLGLPFLRVSPDHGVATNIIGKNKANPDSFLYALQFFEKHHDSL